MHAAFRADDAEFAHIICFVICVLANRPQLEVMMRLTAYSSVAIWSISKLVVVVTGEG
jgi:hypothetical protein